MKNKFKLLCLVWGLSTLAGCGGGGETTPVATNTAPIILVNAAPMANAGADQTVLVGTTAYVDAGASSDANGDSLTYKWTLSTRPAKSVALLSNSAIVRPSLVVDVAGTYIFTLIVNDGKADGLPSTSTIIATEPIIAANDVPLANAGPNQTAIVGKTVTLDGGFPLCQYNLRHLPD